MLLGFKEGAVCIRIGRALTLLHIVYAVQGNEYDTGRRKYCRHRVLLIYWFALPLCPIVCVFLCALENLLDLALD